LLSMFLLRACWSLYVVLTNESQCTYLCIEWVILANLHLVHNCRCAKVMIEVDTRMILWVWLSRQDICCCSHISASSLENCPPG
jgi:hypothetical protein